MDELFNQFKSKVDNFIKTEEINSILKYESVVDCEPLVTFFLPTYSRVDTLRQALYSITSQKFFFKYEILIIDDSTILDETNPTFDFIKNSGINNIRYFVNEKNLGQAGNWNRGFTLAKGKYLSMLHDDDLLIEDYTEKVYKILNVMQGKYFGCIMPCYIPFLDNQKPVYEPKSIKTKLIKEHMINTLMRGMGVTMSPTYGSLFTVEAVKKVGGFNQDFFPCFDYMLGYVMLQNKIPCYITNEVFGYYRIGINAMMKKENIIKAFYVDYNFREMLYSQNCLTKMFSIFFRKVQYYINAKCKINYAKENKVDILIEMIDFKNMYKVNKISYFAFRCLRKLVKFLTGNSYRY